MGHPELRGRAGAAGASSPAATAGCAAFDPPTGKLLWKFDGNPKDAVYELGGTGTRSDFVMAAPVVADGKVYIGIGQDPEHIDRASATCGAST